jgi:hypothetical protein
MRNICPTKSKRCVMKKNMILILSLLALPTLKGGENLVLVKECQKIKFLAEILTNCVRPNGYGYRDSLQILRSWVALDPYDTIQVYGSTCPPAPFLQKTSYPPHVLSSLEPSEKINFIYTLNKYLLREPRAGEIAPTPLTDSEMREALGIKEPKQKEAPLSLRELIEEYTSRRVLLPIPDLPFSLADVLPPR